MDYENFLELIKSRRSVRRFKHETLPDDLLEKVLEAARWAPSGFNLQPWELVVVKDPKLKDDIVKILHEDFAYHARMESTREAWQGPIETPRYLTGQEVDDFSGASVFILIFGDTRTSQGLPMHRRFIHEGIQQAYMSGLSNAFLLMSLAAASLGLGSQWVSGVRNPYPHCLIKQLLGIPVPLEIYDMMALGYRGYVPPPRIVRQKSEFVHYDHAPSESYRTDNQVKEFIKQIRTQHMASDKPKKD